MEGKQWEGGKRKEEKAEQETPYQFLVYSCMELSLNAIGGESFHIPFQ